MNNATSAVVYNLPKTTSYLSSHTLPTNTLVNNNQYKISVQVWETGDASNALSDYEVFQTSSRPKITISTTGIVSSPSNIFSAQYSQAESVPMKSWIAYLYNNSMNIISQSNTQISTPLVYTVDNLINRETYYIEFQAVSNKGLTGTTGKIPFDVLYATPNLDTNLTIRNVDNAGMELSWDVVQIIGKSDNPIYLNGEKLDARANKVSFNQGYSITNDFTLKAWVEGLTNKTVSIDGEYIVSAAAPSNVNALWQQDSAQTSPKTVKIAVRNISPTSTSNFWIQDSTQTNEILLGLFIDKSQPSSSFAWINDNSLISDSRIISATGDNGRLVIEYYNGTFYLVSYSMGNTRTVLSSSVASGNQFYIYIQQIGDIYNLGVTALS